MYDLIQTSYTVGSGGVYKPLGINIYRYGVYSLYSFTMKNFPVTVGKPAYFKDNILDIEKAPF